MVAIHLLEIRNLKTYYKFSRGWIKAVDDISFSLDRGKTLGVAGESGCGKTSLAYSIVRVLPSEGRIIEGQILFDGVNLVTLPEPEMRRIRWKKISMVFQTAMNALNPIFRVRDQLMEAIMAHENVSLREARERVVKAFAFTGIPANRLNSFPHELSGGMKQRVIIAMSLICRPSLVILDEPTTALDVVVQDQILQGIKRLQRKLNFSIILISHDLSILAETCDHTAIMYGGRLVEIADTISIFKDPNHPYTMALLNAFPSITGPQRKLTFLRGSPPNLANPPSACRFEPRCSLAFDLCRHRKPELEKVADGHYSACHLASRNKKSTKL